MLQRLLSALLFFGFVCRHGEAFPFDDSDTTALCAMWNDNSSMTNAGSSYDDYATSIVGSPTCTASTMYATSRDDIVRILNVYRYFVGQPDVENYDTAQEPACSECALMLSEDGGGLSHGPFNEDEVCYSADAAAGCGSSNLASGNDIPSNVIARFINDNNGGEVQGHRRWLLAPQLDDIAYGAGPSAQAFYVFGSDNTKVPAFDYWSWPPRGVLPKDTFGNVRVWSWSGDAVTETASIEYCDIVRLDADSTTSIRSGSCSVETGNYGWQKAYLLPTTYPTEQPAGCYAVDLRVYHDNLPETTISDLSYFVVLHDCDSGGATDVADCEARWEAHLATEPGNSASSLSLPFWL